MKGDVSNVLRLVTFVFLWYGVFLATLAASDPDAIGPNVTIEEDGIINVTTKDEEEGDAHIIFNGDPFLRDPWKEWKEERDREDREQKEREERRVCGRDAGFSLVDEKCNATLLFDLPANKTISLAKHLRSHTRLKRRVLTLERMMRVAMAYIKLGAAVRADKAGRK